MILELEILQNIASKILSFLSPAVIHNLEKYYIIKKIHFLSLMEDMKGDYLEFGVFKGSSFCHSIRCFKKLKKTNHVISDTNFYGFDSFSGFGKLKDNDIHPFYKDENFRTDFSKVEKRIKKVAGHINTILIPGFFKDSLKDGPSSMGIKKVRIIFIDCDTFEASNMALSFCKDVVQEGTFLILDDYFSYKGSDNRGVRRAFLEFLGETIKARHVFNYGMGGVVYVISEINS